MFEYDDIYNKLFENEGFVEILSKFHSNSWNNLEKKERFELIDSFVNKYAEVLNLGELKVKKEDSKNISGSYRDIKTIVNVNVETADKISQYDLIDTLFHELRHNFQHRAVSKNLHDGEIVSEEKRKAWKLNFLVSPRKYGNYISNVGENSHLYLYQPVEKDAFMSGLALTRKSYEIIEQRVGEIDEGFYKYAYYNKDLIMKYFSKEEKYVKEMEEKEREVYDIFLKNNKEYHIEKECLKIANETMKKDVKDMSVEEIMSLFSVYVWAYLDDDYKLDLLQEYDMRVNKYKKAKFSKESNTAFKICGKTNLREDIGNILNDLFSYQFSVIVKMMIDGKIPCDPRLREELEINKFVFDKKEINYVKDSDNFLLYSIQPYALFEGRTVIEWFKKLKEVETKFYGIDNGDYDSWIDFYDNDKYIPYIEKFYDKPFEDIYNELVATMKKRVTEVKKRN